ncbi:NMD3 family protein [uncultured archaeon]|nr:NMD3 family protein [uncultured archaeon]
MQRFCVKCGASTNELVNSLCAACYLEKNPVLELPAKIRVEYDFRSERVKVGRDWVPKSFEALTGIVKEKVVKLGQQKRIPISDVRAFLEPAGDNFSVLVKFRAEVEGISLEVGHRVLLNLEKTISDASSRLASNYYEATIQVRFLENPSPAELNGKVKEISALLDAERQRNELSAIVNVRKTHKGVDLVIGSFKAADKVSQRIARRYRLRVIYSNSLYGVNDSGKNKYRHTYCLKFDNTK